MYRRYVLSMLTLVCALSYIDRGLMTLLMQPIKDELHLSDTQLGFLTGIAFGAFYATLGVPIARWADRGNRASITALAVGLWSGTVMSCLWVGNFVQLVLARVAAGVGESGCLPPTYSLLGDYFPEPGERTRAMAVYWLASPLSTLASFILGGYLNEHYGWRATFFLMGAPAILIAVLIKMTIADPRPPRAQTSEQAQVVPRMRDVVALLWCRRSSRHLILALLLLFTMGYGLAPWYAAFMIRSHGMATSELGLWLGLIFGGSGIVGITLGGEVAARRFQGDEGSQMRMSAIAVASCVPCFVLFLLLPSSSEALLALIPLVTVINLCLAPAFALLQRLVPAEMRATTLSLVMLLANLVGMGVGPQIVGVFSDLFTPALGQDALRYAMLLMSFLALWAAYHFWALSASVKTDLAAVAETSREHTGPGEEQHSPILSASK